MDGDLRSVDSSKPYRRPLRIRTTLALGPCAAALLATPLGAGAAGPSSSEPAARPVGLAVTDVKRGSAKLVWASSLPDAAPKTRYRVYRDGRPYKTVRALSLRVSTAGRTHSYRVAATGVRALAGAQTASVEGIRGHYPPDRPGRLRATRVTESALRLSWSAGSRGTGRIGGYRVFRNGVPVGQVRGLRTSDRNLAAGTRYRYTVAAVDTRGYQSAFTPKLSLRTAKPPQTQGRAHAFLLASTDESFRDLQRHYRQIGTVYPTYFQCRDSDGALRGRDDRLVTSWAQVRGIRVLPRFNCQEPAAVHSILTDETRRADAIAQLVDLARSDGYDGINLDLENGAATDRDALTEFVSQLAARLHAAHKRLSVEVSAKYEDTTTGRSGFYDYAALGGLADNVFVMNWGWHWETSAPGAPDDLELCTKVADYVASMPHKERFVLGTHLYGMDWPNGGGPAGRAPPPQHAPVHALMERYGAGPELDPIADAWTFSYTDSAGAPHEVWFPSTATIARRVGLAHDRGLGIGFWRLGREDSGIWADPLLGPPDPSVV